MKREYFCDGDVEIYEEQDVVFLKAIDLHGLKVDSTGKTVCPVELNADEAIKIAEKLIAFAKEIQKREN